MKTSSPFVSRYEIKYAVPESSIPEISRMLRLYAVHDPFTPPSKSMEYTVRSVYYDTPGLEFYYQKLDGIKIRKKLRIRTYNVLPLSNHSGVLEFAQDTIALQTFDNRFAAHALSLHAVIPSCRSSFVGQGVPIGSREHTPAPLALRWQLRGANHSSRVVGAGSSGSDAGAAVLATRLRSKLDCPAATRSSDMTSSSMPDSCATSCARYP